MKKQSLKHTLSHTQRPLKQCPLCGSETTVTVALDVEENLKLLGRGYCYSHCPDCKVISQQPLPDADLLGNYYRLIDARQQAWQSSAQGQSFLSRAKAKQQQGRGRRSKLLHVLSTAGEQLYPYWHQLKPGPIVDLGAGSGGFCMEAKQRGWSVSGIEQSSQSVDLARQMGVDLIQADLASSLARQLIGSASNVVMNHVFEHVVNPLDFLNTLKTLMQPGSRLILLVPNPNSIWRFLLGSRWYGWDPPVHVHHYSARALQKTLEDIDFKIIELRSIRRHDSFTTALNQLGIQTGRARFLLRALMLPIMPLLAWMGLGPELLCVAEVVAPARDQLAATDAS